MRSKKRSRLIAGGLTVVRAPRTHPDRGPLRTHGLGHSVDDLEREAALVLGRPAVVVRPQVGAGLEELVEHVAVRGVYLDAVEPGAKDGILGGGREPLNVLLDLCMPVVSERGMSSRSVLRTVDSHGTRGDVSPFDGHCGGGEVGVVSILGELLQLGGTPDGPDLHEDVRPLGVDGIRHLSAGGM